MKKSLVLRALIPILHGTFQNLKPRFWVPDTVTTKLYTLFIAQGKEVAIFEGIFFFFIQP